MTRLQRLRNYQSQEFWAILFTRPLAILLLWVCADWRWVTPNRLTLAAFALTLCSAWLIHSGGSPEWIAAAIVLNVAQVLDNADGTLARYHGNSTQLGGYVDKICDALGQIVVFSALSLVAWRRTSLPHYLVLGPLAAWFLLVRGYAKWIVTEPQTAAGSPPPPRRTGTDWARLIGKAVSRIWLFDEVDLPFWIALGLILERIPWLVWVLFISQTVGALVQLVRRGLQARRRDLASRSKEQVIHGQFSATS